MIPMYHISKVTPTYIVNISISNLSNQWTSFQHSWTCLWWQKMFIIRGQCWKNLLP